MNAPILFDTQAILKDTIRKIDFADIDMKNIKKCANPESNRGPNDGNVGFYH